MRRTLGGGLWIALLAITAGCDDPTRFTLNPVLVSDTVDVWALPVNVGRELPTALDIISDGSGLGIEGGRFPNRAADAMEWDFAVRVQGGELVLVPARAILGSGSRAALTRALQGQTFEGLREAPAAAEFLMEEPVVMRVGSVYAARSRETRGGLFGVGCVQFAKLQPLEVDVTEGRLRVQVVTSELCGDHRLAPA